MDNMIDKYDDSDFSFVDYQLFLRKKYRPEFARAMNKLTNPNRFDLSGSVRPEYILSDDELEALFVYIPEFDGKVMLDDINSISK